MGWSGASTLNIVTYIACSLWRPVTAMERMQADVFVSEPDVHATPSFRLFRASVTVDELRATVVRYLGEERTSRSFEGFAHSRGQALEGRSEADIHTLRYAEHLLASAIGTSSSRLALSLLLRRRTVSTKDALKLLDDASAAIQHKPRPAPARHRLCAAGHHGPRPRPAAHGLEPGLRGSLRAAAEPRAGRRRHG